MEKPKIKLTLENIVVETPTQESFDRLMMVAECGGLNWLGGILPTKASFFGWGVFKENTCVEIGKSVVYGSKRYYEKRTGNILSEIEFYNMQNINPKQINQIESYFENIK